MTIYHIPFFCLYNCNDSLATSLKYDRKHVYNIFLYADSSLVESKITLVNHKWDEQLKTSTSKMYKNLENRLTIEVGAC